MEEDLEEPRERRQTDWELTDIQTDRGETGNIEFV